MARVTRKVMEKTVVETNESPVQQQQAQQVPMPKELRQVIATGLQFRDIDPEDQYVAVLSQLCDSSLPWLLKLQDPNNPEVKYTISLKGLIGLAMEDNLTLRPRVKGQSLDVWRNISKGDALSILQALKWLQTTLLPLSPDGKGAVVNVTVYRKAKQDFNSLLASIQL